MCSLNYCHLAWGSKKICDLHVAWNMTRSPLSLQMMAHYRKYLRVPAGSVPNPLQEVSWYHIRGVPSPLQEMSWCKQEVVPTLHRKCPSTIQEVFPTLFWGTIQEVSQSPLRRSPSLMCHFPLRVCLTKKKVKESSIFILRICHQMIVIQPN